MSHHHLRLLKLDLKAALRRFQAHLAALLGDISTASCSKSH
jgi:hypothetical protein